MMSSYYPDAGSAGGEGGKATQQAARDPNPGRQSEETTTDSAEEEDRADDSRSPPMPGKRVHFCTDLPWVLILLLLHAQSFVIRKNSLETGDRSKLLAGYDTDKKFCGLDHPDRSLLFWCRDDSGEHGESAESEFGSTYPICVSECPANDTTYRWCSDHRNHSKLLQDYPTSLVGEWCVPSNHTQMRSIFSHVLGDGTVSMGIKLYHDIQSCGTTVFSISGSLAVVLGILFLALLGFCGPALLHVCKATLVLCSFWTSYYFYCLAVPGGLLSVVLPTQKVGTQPNAMEIQSYLALVAAFFAAGVIQLCWFYCGQADLRASIGCIQAASGCMIRNKSLFFEPLLATVIKIVLLLINGLSIVQLVATGDIQPSGDFGLRRSVHFTDEQWYYLFYLIVMSAWSLEMAFALSNYAIVYATQIWYYEQDNAPRCLVFRGYWNCLRYHLGTIAIGSLLLTLLRPLVWSTRLISWSTKGENNECMRKCCSSCVSCFEEGLCYVTRNAYMDVATTSSEYKVASVRVVKLMRSYPQVKALLGAQIIFNISGTGIITYICGYVTLILTSEMRHFTRTSSDQFIDNSTFIAVAAGGFAFFISSCFMNVFDTVGETILYCYATGLRRQDAVQAQRRTYAGEGGDNTLAGTVTNLWDFFFADGDSEGEEEELDPGNLHALLNQQTWDR